MKKKPPPEPPKPIEWTRADPVALADFDIHSKRCVMNCGQASTDPRPWPEVKFLCDECVPVMPRVVIEAVGWQYRFKRADGTWSKWGDCPRATYAAMLAAGRPESFEVRELIPQADAMTRRPGITREELIALRSTFKGNQGAQKMQALGRLPTGTMNKTETRYSERLELRRIAGEVLWWKFEAIKLRLADNTFLTVDFAVMLADCTLEMHDVKGSKAIYTDDAKAKMKIADELFPFVFRVAYPGERRGADWIIEEV